MDNVYGWFVWHRIIVLYDIFLIESEDKSLISVNGSEQNRSSLNNLFTNLIS